MKIGTLEKYFELNKNKNTTNQNLWDVGKEEQALNYLVKKSQ